MRQYNAAKAKHPDCLLFFRLGDFFEMFYEDAVTASQALDITLTKRRDRQGKPIPMCGVPVHAADGYLAKLLQRGHRVAICDQVENPKQAGGRLVRREVVRVLSPGTAIDPGLLRAGENNYLAAVWEKRGTAGVAYADVSTGEFRTTEIPSGEVRDMVEAIRAKEILRADGQRLLDLDDDSRDDATMPPSMVTKVESWAFEPDYGQRLLQETFRLHNLAGLGLDGRPLCVAAAGALVHYLRETQRTALPHLSPPVFSGRKDWMVLDPLTVRHLELFDPLYQQTSTTLLFALDRTTTSMGARLLRSRLLRPSLDQQEIEERLEAVESLCRSTIVRSELKRELTPLYDIERLLARVTLGSAGPREVFNLGSSLTRIPGIRGFVSELHGRRAQAILDRLDDLDDVSGQILATLVPDPPATLGDGSAIADGVDAELDELRTIQRDSRRILAELEQRERSDTGIETLKVRYNNVFGYFIEVSRANLAKVPDHYERKQTLVNAERFATRELKELEAKVLAAEEQIGARVGAVFEGLRQDIAAQAQRIRRSAGAIAEADVLRCLAEVAVESDYSRPRFSDRGEIHIEAGRHAVVERILEDASGERFIENDVYLDSGDHRLAVITGPNMGGKSTYLRQVALVAVMAQMGSFVPARKAVLPLIDRIFTRIGASDSLAKGRSTFMVEMTETAQIIHLATDRSLILLDEVGRGTSTYDGLAIAWAVAEHLLEEVRAKTLFATHYHELTALEDHHSGIVNLHVSAKKAGDKLVFLRRIQPGSADRSYGIEVAQLAGLPKSVLERAKHVLAQHEQSAGGIRGAEGSGQASGQETIFGQLPRPIEEELRNLNIAMLSPLEALSLLYEWQTAIEA